MYLLLNESKSYFMILFYRSPQEFISSQQLQDKLKQDTLVFDKLPNLKEKNIEKNYKELEKAISKLNR